MRKGIKIFLSFISSILLLSLVIPVVSTILISSYSIQNFVVDRLTDYFSKRLETTVSIDRGGIKLFNRVTAEGVYVQDLQGDTLLYVAHLDVGLRGYNPWNGLLRLGDVSLSGANFRVVQDSTGVTNLKYLTDKLKRDDRPERKPLTLRAGSLTIDTARFRLQRHEIPPRAGSINFADLDVSLHSLDMERIELIGDSISARINTLSAQEKSGFALRRFSGEEVQVWGQGIRAEGLRLYDNDSQLFIPELSLNYSDWSAFGRYIEQVEMHAVIEDSRLALRSIGWFTPALQGKQSAVQLDGTIDGTVDNLSGRLNEAVIGNTRLDTRFEITGLPNINDTRFNLEVDRLSTTPASATQIYRDMTGKMLPKGVQTTFQRMGWLTLSGSFNGLLSNFLAEGTLRGAPGSVDFHLRMNPQGNGRTGVDGNVSTGGFQLGRLLAVDSLGSAALSAQVTGFLGRDSLQLATDATVEHLHFQGYDYRDIQIDGQIRNNYYTGFIGSTDPNADFRLNGTFDFDGEVPEYNFEMALNRLDLHALNLNRRDSVSVLQADMQINAQGTTLNEITGTGTVSNLVYAFPGDTLRSQRLTISGDNGSEQKHIRFRSDFLDAELSSRLSVVDLAASVRQTLHYYLPSLSGEYVTPNVSTDTTASADNYYALQLNIKENGEFASALLPGLYVSPGTNLSALLNPAQRNFSLIVHSDLIEYNNIYIANLEATNRNQADSIALYLRTEEVGIDNFYMPGLTIHGGIRDNRVSLSAGFENSTNGMLATINTLSQLRVDTLGQNHLWHTRFTASRLRFSGQEWRISSPEITWGNGTVDVDQFRMVTADQDQEFLLNGRLSREATDTLRLSMTHFDLSPLSGLISRYGYRVSGHTDGHAELIAGRGDALFYGRIAFNGVHINDIPVSNSTFVSEWDPVQERVRIALELESGESVLEGGFRPSDRRYFVNANIPDIDLSLLEPVLKGVLTDIEGTANAEVVLTGTGSQPSLNGQITVPNFAATVDFTQARYHFSDAVVNVQDNNLILPRTTLYDEESGTGDLELTLLTRHFSQLSYQVRVTPRQMLALNTTMGDNDYFYGKAYASGTVSIDGDQRGVNMNMNLSTDDNSSFFMPLNGASSISEADFIVFEDPNQAAPQETLTRYQLLQQMRERRLANSGQSDLDINMVINVRPNTEVQLVIDPKIGDVIKANGTGALTLHVRPREDVFTLFGDYRISEGSYLFTLMNILNKRFTIEPGSSIQWVGNPLDAILDVTATYRVRASTAPITGDTRVVPVDCQIMLSDRLSQPTINLDITLPSADSDFRNALQTAMNTQEQKSQQFVWLLMSGSFYGGAYDNIGTATTATTGIEFLTNQLSNWLSTERFNFSLGYTLGSEQMQTSDEVEGMFSGEIIPNKLLLEGEVNYNLATNNADPRNNQLSGDFYLTYIIGRMGNLRAKVFSRTIDRYDENQGLQEQGAGFYYQQDFNRLRDIFRRTRRNRPTRSEQPDRPDQSD
ncbi:MAG: translocation/assembly module TamB domain-containing protein [Rikenellaceae bacterium]|jgi:hypothetical protein|nr:translocation/assembly module TamB domain-containing protein [Rikenellaceae bacterium]